MSRGVDMSAEASYRYAIASVNSSDDHRRMLSDDKMASGAARSDVMNFIELPKTQVDATQKIEAKRLRDDIAIITPTRQFLSPDVGPGSHLFGFHHNYASGYGVPGLSGTNLERVPSVNRLQPQSSTETSGLGETVTSGFSSQESVHSVGNYNVHTPTESSSHKAIGHAGDNSQPSKTSRGTNVWHESRHDSGGRSLSPLEARELIGQHEHSRDPQHHAPRTAIRHGAREPNEDSARAGGKGHDPSSRAERFRTAGVNQGDGGSISDSVGTREVKRQTERDRIGSAAERGDGCTPLDAEGFAVRTGIDRVASPRVRGKANVAVPDQRRGEVESAFKTGASGPPITDKNREREIRGKDKHQHKFVRETGGPRESAAESGHTSRKIVQTQVDDKVRERDRIHKVQTGYDVHPQSKRVDAHAKLLPRDIYVAGDYSVQGSYVSKERTVPQRISHPLHDDHKSRHRESGIYFVVAGSSDREQANISDDAKRGDRRLEKQKSRDSGIERTLERQRKNDSTPGRGTHWNADDSLERSGDKHRQTTPNASKPLDRQLPREGRYPSAEKQLSRDSGTGRSLDEQNTKNGVISKDMRNHEIHTDERDHAQLDLTLWRNKNPQKPTRLHAVDDHRTKTSPKQSAVHGESKTDTAQSASENGNNIFRQKPAAESTRHRHAANKPIGEGRKEETYQTSAGPHHQRESDREKQRQDKETLHKIGGSIDKYPSPRSAKLIENAAKCADSMVDHYIPSDKVDTRVPVDKKLLPDRQHGESYGWNRRHPPHRHASDHYFDDDRHRPLSGVAGDQQKHPPHTAHPASRRVDGTLADNQVQTAGRRTGSERRRDAAGQVSKDIDAETVFKSVIPLSSSAPGSRRPIQIIVDSDMNAEQFHPKTTQQRNTKGREKYQHTFPESGAKGKENFAYDQTEIPAKLDKNSLTTSGIQDYGVSMGADGHKLSEGRQPNTIVTVTPTFPAYCAPPSYAHRKGDTSFEPHMARPPPHVSSHIMDATFDDLFSQANSGRGPVPGGGNGPGVDVVVTGVSGHLVPGLQVDQVNHEWKRRESRGSMRSRSSPGGSFRSRSGSMRRNGRGLFLGVHTESAWTRWSRDRRASYRRRVELLEKPLESTVRVSTPVRKARQEGLKFVHPDLEGNYLSEEDLNELRRHKQQKFRAIRVIEQKRNAKFTLKSELHLTAHQWKLLGDFWEHPAFVHGRHVGLFLMFVSFLIMVVSITHGDWLLYEAWNMTVHEGLWVNCSRPTLLPANETCQPSNGGGFSGGVWHTCYQNLSDPQALAKCPDKRQPWQNAVVGLMIFAASFGVLASVLSICGVCTTPLPRKIYYFHSAGEIFFICALSTGVALMVFPIAIELDVSISSHRYGIGYGLGWGGAFFFLAAAVCMSLDDLVREVSRAKCCRWCWKSKTNDRTELRQV